MILAIPSAFTIITSIIVLLVLLLVYKFYLRPYYLIKYYEKQGGVALFHWKLLRHFENTKNAETKGDYYYIDKQTIKKYPQARFIVENFMSKAVIILSDLEMIKEYLRKQEIYQKDRELFSTVIGMSPEFTLFLEGDAWKKKRRIISAAFNFEFLKGVVPKIVDVAQEKMSDWVAKGELKDIKLFSKISTITAEVTGRFFFGKRVTKYQVQGLPVSAALQLLKMKTQAEIPTLSCLLFGSGFVKTGILPRHKKLNNFNKEVRACCMKMIKETDKVSESENNLLESLLNLKNTNNKEYGLTDDQVVDEFIGLFLAGTDTTANLISSSIYFLWKYPHVLEKVTEEVNREFGNIETLTVDNLNRMEYTTAFLKEALRLGGPIGTVFARNAVQDDDLCGVKIKKGTRVVIRQAMFFQSEIFFPNPNEICPERWLPNSPYNQDLVKNNPYAYLPFLAGPRNCVGQHLAVNEAKIVLGVLIKKFKFSFPENYQFKLIQRAGYVPLHPLIVTLESRD